MTTKIEWTDETWNPVTGCTPISEGCVNCYAKRMSNRLKGRYGYDKDNPFRVTVHQDKLIPQWLGAKPKMVFVCSMGDLFHDDVADRVIEDVMDCAITMAHSDHVCLFLTKRVERAADWWHSFMPRFNESVFSGIWIGTTVENQKRADERIPHLLEIPAAVRFLSVEPMLEEINLPFHSVRGHKKLDWVICGAETGPGARIMKDRWAIKLAQDCAYGEVPFFFKKPSAHSNLGGMPREFPKNKTPIPQTIPQTGNQDNKKGLAKCSQTLDTLSGVPKGI